MHNDAQRRLSESLMEEWHGKGRCGSKVTVGSATDDTAQTSKARKWGKLLGATTAKPIRLSSNVLLFYLPCALPIG